MSVNQTGRSIPSAPPSPSPTVAPKWLAGVGFLTGLGALIASSCCVLPLGLAALGAGAGVMGGLNDFAAWRVPLLSVSALAVAGGWGAWWMKRQEACATDPHCATMSRTRSTTTLLITATVIVIAAAGWEHVDPLLLKLLNGH